MNEYKGNDIVVRYDETTCTHSGNCVKGLPSVFDVKATPWVHANGASVDAIKKAVANCPSGALSYEVVSKK
jgi:uncharacterized Fe-S cluster protein YjdI